MAPTRPRLVTGDTLAAPSSAARTSSATSRLTSVSTLVWDW